MKKTSINRSIFVKLIVIIVIYGVLMNIAVALFLRYSKDFKPKPFNKMFFVKMDEYIVKDLGYPPDTLKARKLSLDLNLNIRCEYHGVNWTTSEEIPTFEELSKTEDFKKNYDIKEAFSLLYKNKIYGIHKIPDGIYIFSYYSQKDIFNIEKAIIALIVLLSAIFIPLYFLLRWLFKPLKSLSTAVQQIGAGNFNVELPLEKKDEFGDLARSLQEMSTRVKDSIRAKEQLLIDVSHELRTPLTRIKFGLELDMPKDKINEDVMEIENMIKKILDYYRNEYYYLKVNLRDTDLITLLENVITSFDLHKNRIEFLNFSKNKSNLIIKADEEKLKIAFSNLINNALNYSPENKNVILSINESDEFYEVAVKDYGEGIKKEDIYKVFEPFARIDTSRSKKTGGYGLGLAIVKKIIDLHGAQIELRSEENEGTEMIVKFKK